MLGPPCVQRVLVDLAGGPGTGTEGFGARMGRILCKGAKRSPLPPTVISAVVSVDGRPVRLQLCDTAGQVSMVSFSQLGAGTACSGPPEPPSGARSLRPRRGRRSGAPLRGWGGGDGSALIKPGLASSAWAGRGTGVKNSAYLTGVSDLIYFLVFIKNDQ